MLKALLISSLVLNVGLLLGRLSGFVRESFVAMSYGASAQADIVVLMLTVPDLLVSILVAGAMGIVLIPEFHENQRKAKTLLFQSMVFFGVVFTLISAFLYWQSYSLVELLAPGFSDEQRLEASISLSWVIWLVPLTVLAGIVTAYLHYENKFAIASLGTLIVNVTIIAGLLLVYYGVGSIFMVAMFVLLGGALRLFSQLALIDIRWHPLQSFDSVLLNKSIFSRYMQALLSGSILLFIPVLARAFASYSGEGSLAIMNYAIKLIEFPMAIAITIFTVTLFPRLSSSFLEDKKLYNKLVNYGFQATLGISVLIMISLILLSNYYVDVVFNYGYMQAEDLLLIQQLITIGLLSLPLQGTSLFLTAIFHSQKKTKIPLIVNSMGLLVFLLTYMTHFFGEGLEAIVWGVFYSYGLICLLQLFLLSRSGIRIKKMFLNASFFVGLISSSLILYFLINWVSYAGFSSVITLFLAMLSGLLSLVVLALFNQEFRVVIRSKVSSL